MVNIDNITDAEWRKPSNIAQHKVMRDKINEIITVVNEGGGGGGGGGGGDGDGDSLSTLLDTTIPAIQAELAQKADKTEFALLIAQLFPPVDCTTVAQLYNGDTSVRVTLPINAVNCTDLNSMFYGCSNLKMVGYIHTPNITNMNGMFSRCSSLKTIPLLDTSSVVNIGNMFSGCTSLTTIPSLDTSKVTYMGYMFDGCTSLTSVTFQCNDVRPYGSNMFRNTPIASGNGCIYVPDSLVQTYKTASGWSTHASVIYGHSDKP